MRPSGTNRSACSPASRAIKRVWHPADFVAEATIGAIAERRIAAASTQGTDTVQNAASEARLLGGSPEAIIFAVASGAPLAPLRNAAIIATRAAGAVASDQDEQWRPHVTLCYSTSDQPARPIIDALGTSLPEQTIAVRRLSLVIQNGSELAWDWTILGSANLAAPAHAR